MDENNLNNLGKKLFENYRLEKLPDDFTEKLMVRIEEEKSVVKQSHSLFSKKFIILFTITFLSIFAIGLYFNDTGAESTHETTQQITETVSSYIDFNQILEFLNFELEISLFVKLIVIAVVILIAIDLVSGSLIDYFLDSKTKKEGS